MKNIFIGLFVLFFTVVPSHVNAAYDYGTTNADKLKAANWTDADINALNLNTNNLSSGSTHKETFTNPNGGNTATINENLYKNEPSKNKLNPREVGGLSAKLTEGGSTVNSNNINAENTYQLNDGLTSNYIYDPTPSNKTNNDEVVIGTATKEGQFFVHKEPLKKEVSGRTNEENRTSKDVRSLDGFLNANDISKDRQSGTTVAQKNKLDDLVQERISLTPGHDAALKAYQDANKARRDYENNGGDITSAIYGALKQREGDTKGELDKYKEEIRYIDEQRQAEQERRDALSNPVQELGADKCTGALDTISNSFYCMTVAVAKFSNIIFKLVSFVAYIAGTLFDFSLEFSINSAEFLKRLGVIEVTWSFIRDVLNMTFIFILLWTAVQILIGNEGKYNAQKMLRNVIIVAILMNFSLFAAKLMVDGSNIVSLKIYEAMKASTDNQGASISVRVMNTVGLTTLYDVSQIFSENTIQAQGNCATNPGALITVSVMGSIFLIILCLALGLAAILFLVRLVNIIILLIKSPLWVWGHVLPGSKRVSELKDKWWSEMMHVLTFPIMYLFWMLVAVIVFDKLGKSAGGGENTSLLKLICEAPGAGGLGSSISAVAIFAIVIIFMMKAIEYGFNNAGNGGPDSFGSKFSSDMAKRFSGYQTAMTRGLAKKAGDVAMIPTKFAGRVALNSGVGLSKVPLRLGTGLAGLGVGKKGWQGFKDGYVDPTITAKTIAGNIARNQAINGGIVGDVTGLNKAAGKLAKNWEDPTNSRGDTKKKADEKRTASAAEKEANRTSAIEKAYRTDTHEEWLKKNSGGTFADYTNYVEKNTVDKIEKLFGKGVAGMTGANRDEHGAPTTHIQDLMKNSLKETKDASGRVTAVRFSDYDLYNGIQNMLSHKTTAEIIKGNKTKIERFTNIRADARMKASKKVFEEKQTKARQKDSAEKTKEVLKKATEKLKEKISKIAAEAAIETAISGSTVYTGSGDNDDTVVELNKAINDYNSANSVSSPNPNTLISIKARIDKAKEKHLEFIEKQKELLIKKEKQLDDHEAKIKKAEEAKDKK
jgi:hypothetical protein